MVIHVMIWTGVMEIDVLCIFDYISFHKYNCVLTLFGQYVSVYTVGIYFPIIPFT